MRLQAEGRAHCQGCEQTSGGGGGGDEVARGRDSWLRSKKIESMAAMRMQRGC